MKSIPGVALEEGVSQAAALFLRHLGGRLRLGGNSFENLIQLSTAVSPKNGHQPNFGRKIWTCFR
jgi:hypothetical protein